MASSETEAAAARPERGWPRAAALLLVALAFPGSRAAILLAVAYLVMIAGLPVRRWSAWIMGALMAGAMLGGDRAGLWWTERGWALLVAGWFVALTLTQPDAGFLPRALGAVAGAAAVAAGLVLTRSGVWDTRNFQIGERVHADVGAAMTAMQRFREMRQEPAQLSPAIVSALDALAQSQIEIFPAIVGLASIAALGVAWWLYVRMAHGSDQGLLPLREFRFNDHLVWLFIAGLALVLVGGGEGVQRTGSNAVVFMSGLYALRGAAVVTFFGAGVSVFGVVMLMLALTFWPVLVVGVLVIGLGDTWLDLRARARATTA